ncbi:MAG: efflux RND transporter permease subunit, partial [Thermoanaerobaculia bacterium]
MALATRRPVALSMIVLTVGIFGVISFQRLPQNLMPDISYPTITVRAEYSGASPIDVEMRVSRRLEEVLSQVRKLRRVSSVSRAERSDVILEFAWQTDMSLATMDVREKVDQAILPDGIQRPTILRYDPTLDPILQVGLYRRGGSREADPEELIELRLAAEDLIERELETVDGVAAVQVRGGLEREILIHVSEAQLKSHALSTALINQRLREENLNQASGQLYEGDQAYVVRTVNEFQNLEEIGEIIVKREGTVPIRLREVAHISWGHAEPEVLSRINGNPCVKIDIYKEADANIVEVARRVQARLFGTPAERRRLQEIEAKKRESEAGVAAAKGREPPQPSRKKDEPAKGKKGLLGMLGEGLKGGEGALPGFLAAKLPAGMALEVMSDQSVFIQKSLDDVYQTAVSGGILSALIIYLFLRNFWFTLVVNLSVPISVIATFVVMYVLGVSLNLMSLGGLALGIGMLVDNSIVVLESIFRCREEGDGARAAAVRGTLEVAGAVVASTLTAVAVFFPIVFVEGVAGQVFRDQALT